MKRYIYSFFKILFVTSIFCFFSQQAEAAQMLLSSSKLSVQEGETFKVRIFVNTQGEAINTSEAVVVFPKDVVQVTAIDTSSSILDLWVDPVKFSNTNGTISFNGGVVNPGFSGSNGTLFSATVKAKKSGSADFLLKNASIRANDGVGTDVLSDTQSVSVTVRELAQKEVKKKDNIDKTNPDNLSVTIQKNEKNQQVLILQGHDDVGLDKFILTSSSFETVEISAENGYAEFVIPESIKEGVHAVSVSLFDTSGNKKETSANFTVSENPPQINDFSKNIVVGKPARVIGSTYKPNTDLVLAVVFPSKRLETYMITSDENGDFDFTTEPFTQNGVYTLWIQKADLKGLNNSASEKVYIQTLPTVLQKTIIKIENAGIFVYEKIKEGYLIVVNFVHKIINQKNIFSIILFLLLPVIVILSIFIFLYKFGFRIVRVSKNKE